MGVPHRSDTVAILTAAGASRRMGTPKALVPWPPGSPDALPLLRFQLQQLAGFRDVVVVTGAESLEHQVFEAPARRVHNPDWASGRSSSLEVGARALPDDAAWLLIAAIDQPLVPEVIDALLAAPGDGPHIPIHAGRRGHPVLLPGRLLGSLRTVSTWPEGLRSLVRSEDPTLVPVDTPAIHLDLNTPEQLMASSPSGRETA